MPQPPAHSHAVSARIPTSRLANDMVRLAQELVPGQSYVVYDLEKMRKGHTTRQVVQQVRKDLQKRSVSGGKIKTVLKTMMDCLEEEDGSHTLFISGSAQDKPLCVMLLSPESKKDVSKLPLPGNNGWQPMTRQDGAYHELAHAIAPPVESKEHDKPAEEQARYFYRNQLDEVFADVFSALVQLREEGEAAAQRWQKIAQWRYLRAFTEAEITLWNNDLSSDHLTSHGIRAAIKEYHDRKNTPQALNKLAMADIEALASHILARHGLEPIDPVERTIDLFEANTKLDLYIAGKLPENEFHTPLGDASLRRWRRLRKADAFPPLWGDAAIIPEGERLPRAIELGFLDSRKPWVREMEKEWKARAKEVGLPPLIPFSVQPLDRSPQGQPASFAERVRSRGRGSELA